MKTSSFQFIDIGNNDSLQNFALLLGTKVTDNTITMPAHIGKGSIQKVQVSKGLELTIWNIRLNEPLELIKIAALQGASRVYTLTYIFTPGHFLMQKETEANATTLEGDAHLFFDPGNQDIKFTILPEVKTRAIVISIETKWLLEKFNYCLPLLREPMHYLLNNDNPSLYYRPVFPDNYKDASDLFHHFMTEPHDMFYIKARILLLLSQFFKELFSKTPLQTADSNILHYEKMKTVERLLREHINSDLPAVSTIAKVVALSESSLKRYFKLMFGSSLYEYYLQKKMEYAKMQLLEKKLPVKEVAYMLGYESSGSFIQIFKKHYQIPPGLLQKEDRKTVRIKKVNSNTNTDDVK